MKLRNRFLYFVIILHLALTVLAYFLLAYNKWLFFGIQILVVVSAFISYRLYLSFVKPLEILASGVETIRDRDFSCTIIETGNEELDRLIDVYNRMIDQLRRERLTQQEQDYFLERLIRVASIGVIVLDLDKKISMFNPAAEKMLGKTIGLKVGQALKDVAVGVNGWLSDLKPGTSQVVRISGVHVYRCHKSEFPDRGFGRQFILLEELTDEIIETQKRAYEKVVRAMSHEVNNSVGAINSILNSILDYETQLTEMDRRDYHDALGVAIERNTRLGKFMASYADVVRIPPPRRVKYDLHNLLKSIHALMNKDCRERNIEWSFQLAPGPFEIEMDVNLMEQAVINIIKNAVEAIDHGGIITVVTSFSPKMIRVIDTGKGLSREIVPNLFTPFYTTKKYGQGIGLTLVREILMNHGFDFNLQTNADNKTEFQIVFEE